MFDSNIYEVMSFVMLVIAFLAWCVVAVCITYRLYEERRRKRKLSEAVESMESEELWPCMKQTEKPESGEQPKDR